MTNFQITDKEKARQIERILYNAYLPLDKSEEARKYIEENYDFSTLTSKVGEQFLGVNLEYDDEFEEKLFQLFGE